MKKIVTIKQKMAAKLSTLIIAACVAAPFAHAQLTPDVDIKGINQINTDPVLNPIVGLAGVKTDPVLNPNPVVGLAGVKTDPVLNPNPVVGLAGVKTDPVLAPAPSTAGFALNFTPVLELAAALQKNGHKVEVRIHQYDGMEVALITLNGKTLSPYILSCKNC